ncbi:MAG: alpha/beta hydrolase fold domain-containing protein [Clostridia bacterium]
MKNKIVKSIVALLLIIALMMVIVVIYYKTVDIKTEEPKEIESVCEVSIQEYTGRKVFVVKPKEQNETEYTIIYIHGGSYMAEVTKEHWEFIRKIAVDTNATIIVPDYPLAPKYTYKEVFEMMEPLYKDVVEKVDSKDLIVMGDSAGGGLALALEEKLSQEGVSMPEKTILISPWLDVRLNNPEIEEVQKRDKELSKTKLQLAGIAYAGEDGINSYLVNPIDGDLSKLKNITIFTGTNDILNPDIHLIQEKAKEQGVTINIKEYENAGHIWMIEKNSTQELVQQGYEEILKLIID